MDFGFNDEQDMLRGAFVTRSRRSRGGVITSSLRGSDIDVDLGKVHLAGVRVSRAGMLPGCGPEAVLGQHVAALVLQCAESVASLAKSYVGQACADLTGEALQIHGGIGPTREHDVHFCSRRVKSNEVLLGDPAWHRQDISSIAGGST